MKVIIILTLCLYFFKESSCQSQSVCKQLGEFCGGIAAFQCCAGLNCALDGNYPDAGGHCLPAETKPVDCKQLGQMCGGFAGFQCCGGLKCKGVATYPDAAGTCSPSIKPLPNPLPNIYPPLF